MRDLARRPARLVARRPSVATLHFLRGQDADGRLRELPLLRDAVCSGEVSFWVARRVAGMVTPETEAACLRDVRGRTVRAVEAIVRAVREAERGQAAQPEVESSEDAERVRMRLPCSAPTYGIWTAGVELARRVAGEPLPVWACAERMAGEAASAVGAESADAPRAGWARARRPARSTPEEIGQREAAWPRLRWRALRRTLPPELAALGEGLDDCSALEVDRRFRAAVAFLQALDLEVGRILRQVADRGLRRELGFDSFQHYVRERLDLAPRTARRWVSLARGEHRATAVATAFREGRVTAFQASALGPVANLDNARKWVARAERVWLRRLGGRGGGRAEEGDHLLRPTGGRGVLPGDGPQGRARAVAGPTRSAPGSSWGSSSAATRTSSATASAAPHRAAPPAAGSRAIASGSGRQAGPTSRGTGPRCASSTITTRCTVRTRAGCASTGGPGMD